MANIRGLRWEPGDNTVLDILQANVVVAGIVLLLVGGSGLLRGAVGEGGLFGVGLLDVPEPAGQVHHQALLDVGMGDAVVANGLPDGGIGVGQAVADNVRAEGKVGIELGEMGLNDLEVERGELLGSLLPLLDLVGHFGYMVGVVGGVVGL